MHDVTQIIDSLQINLRFSYKLIIKTKKNKRKVNNSVFKCEFFGQDIFYELNNFQNHVGLCFEQRVFF